MVQANADQNVKSLSSALYEGKARMWRAEQSKTVPCKLCGFAGWSDKMLHGDKALGTRD